MDQGRRADDEQHAPSSADSATASAAEIRREVGRTPPDLAWIEPGFAIGSRPYAEQRTAIRELGVQTVIALHPPGAYEADEWAGLGIEFVTLPTEDWVAIPADRFTAVVDEVLARRAAGQSLLLHCLAGVNRAPTFAAAVLCRRDGLSAEEAVARVRAARPAASPTPEQMASLQHWLSRTQSPRGP